MMQQQFKRVEATDLAFFKSVLGDAWVLMEGDVYQTFTHDYTEDYRYNPEVVLCPADKLEIAKILSYCNENRIPVTAAGARTGLSGGMLTVFGGVSLATHRLNRILDIDQRNFQVTTQPGVITQQLQDAVWEKGLFYPVDPASRGSCFIGGNIAEGSGGMRAVKYGITKDYVLDLEVVLANGEIIRTGAKTLKNSTGYNLTQLMVGSEGTLGIVTEIILKLEPKPNKRQLLLIPFKHAEQACDAVSSIFYAGVLPAAIEFMEKAAIDYAQRYLGVQYFNTEGIEAHLLIEIDGADEASLFKDAEAVFNVMEAYEVGEVLMAESEEEQNRLWKVRRTIGEATRAGNVVKEEDTCVPRAEMAKLVKFIRQTAQKYDFEAFSFGHAGDGNLHCHIVRTHQDDQQWHEGMQQPIREIFSFVKSLGGTLSGEHGIGWAQKAYMDIQFSPVELGLMRGIKQVFDPNGILNPGKKLP